MKMTITTQDGRVSYKCSESVTYDDALQILFSTLLGMMDAVVNQTPAELRADAKGDVYDRFNVAASRTLEAFAPEFELRPNLTALAIKEAEDRIVMEGRLHEVEPGT